MLSEQQYNRTGCPAPQKASVNRAKGPHCKLEVSSSAVLLCGLASWLLNIFR